MKAKRIFEEIRNSKVFYSLIGLIILVIFSAIAAPNFRTVDNIITVFRQASVLLVLSAGLTAVLLTGGMDLSVGATAGFSALKMVSPFRQPLFWEFLLDW